MKTKKIITCDISKVYLLNKDTLFIDIQSEQNFELKDFNQLVAAAEKLGKGKRMYNIINVGELTIPDVDARNASASKEGSVFKKADAFIIHSLPQKIIANGYLKINKPAVPTKFFNEVDKAKEWIEKLKIIESKPIHSLEDKPSIWRFINSMLRKYWMEIGAYPNEI